MNDPVNTDFYGAKVFVFFGEDLLVILRDDIPNIPFPNQWDIPGGGREVGETPQETAIRETYEEVAIRLTPDDLGDGWRFAASTKGGAHIYVFVARLPKERVMEVALGDEGQMLTLMSVDTFLEHPKVIGPFKDHLRVILGQAPAG